MVPLSSCAVSWLVQCRAEEQNASVYGHGKSVVLIDNDGPAKPIENQPRYRGMPDTPNERLTTVLRASPPSPRLASPPSPRLACAPLPPSR